MSAAGSKAPLIVWDVDDVLNRLTELWFESFAKARGLSAPYSSLRDNPPLQALGLDREEYLASLDDFRATRYSELEPRPELLSWFEREGDCFRHVALSAVPRRFAHVSAQWTLLHFGRWIRGFHFVPSPRAGDPLPAHDREKADVIERLGAALFIDDIEANVEKAAARGFGVLLFPAPWNAMRETSVHDAIESLDKKLKQELR